MENAFAFCFVLQPNLLLFCFPFFLLSFIQYNAIHAALLRKPIALCHSLLLLCTKKTKKKLLNATIPSDFFVSVFYTTPLRYNTPFLYENFYTKNKVHYFKVFCCFFFAVINNVFVVKIIVKTTTNQHKENVQNLRVINLNL